MTILARHLSLRLAAGWSLVLAIAASVFGLLFLVSEMERVTDAYSLGDVALFVALSLPARILELAPVGILLGSLLVLAGLEKGNELTVITMAGIGPKGLLRLLTLPLILLMALLWAGAEFATAPLHRLAEEHRAERQGAGVGLIGGSLWLKDGSRYVRLGGLDTAGQPRNISIYTLAEDGALVRFVRGDRGEVISDRRWRLHDVVVKERRGGLLTTSTLPELEVDRLWSRRELPSLAHSADSMPPSVLYRYVDYLEETGQRAEFHGLSFWRRVLLPLNCAAMLLLAIPLAGRPGSGRAGLGWQLGLGALIGMIFYLGGQVIYAVGLIAAIHPAVTSALPVIITAGVALMLWRRRRW